MQFTKSILICTSIIVTAIAGGNRQNASSAVIPKVDYNEFKKNVTDYRSLLISHPAKDIRNYLFKLVYEDLYDYWAGTRWEFHGETRQPKTGAIACGYFVTNTLTDLGFKIDRVGLAEGVSGKMVKKLCVNIKSFNGLNRLNDYLATQPANSVFIVGLDFHTGYIIKTTTDCYFFHSTYLKSAGVVKEKINESLALANNKFFMIGSLSANHYLLRKWVGGKSLI